MSPPPGSFVVSFHLDPNHLVLAGCGVLGVLFLAFIAGGLVSLRSNTVRPGFLAYARERTAGAAGMDDAALREALLTRRHLQAWEMFVAGAVAELVLAGWLGASWLTRGDFLLVSALHGWATYLTVLFWPLLLSFAGRAYGIYRWRASPVGHPPAGDEPRPLWLSDVMPRWLVVAYAVGCALLWATALIALPAAQEHPTTELLGGEVVPLPLGRWIALAAPVAALLTTALVVALMRWIVTRPAVRFCADARQSAAYDAGFRQESVLAQALLGAQFLFFLTVFQGMTILDTLSLARSSVVTLLLLPVFAVIFGGYFVVLFKMLGLQRAHISGARGPLGAS